MWRTSGLKPAEVTHTCMQAFEIMEIYLELLVVRLNLIEKSKDIPNDMFECLSSLVYAASRVQVRLPYAASTAALHAQTRESQLNSAPWQGLCGFISMVL